MSSNIIIRKQRLKVKTADESYAFTVRKQVNDQLQYDLLPVYEAAFGEIQEDLFIDKISIDLGICKPQELNTQLPLKLKHALESWLVEEKRSGRWHQMRSGFKENNLSTEKTTKKTDKITALIYWLEKGIYPWWFKPGQKNISAIISAFTKNEIEDFLSVLINLLQHSTGTRKETIIIRLLQQVNKELFEKIVANLAELLSDVRMKDDVLFFATSQTVDALKDWFFISEKNYRETLLGYLFNVIEKKMVFSSKGFLLTLIRSTHKDELSMKMQTEDLDIDNYSNEKRKKFDLLPGELKKIITEVYTTLPDDINEPTSRQKNRNDQFEKIDDSNQPLVSDVFSEEEAIYIPNAGLLILHPFLISLFEELKLLDADHNFLSGECRDKAIVLLNYLCTGEDEYDETEMVFNKILCGSKPEDNLPNDIWLTEKEKIECDHLLDTVIKYWEALKGSGKEALRETFFKRNGKLSFKSDQYLIQVEKNATDILIERLPWGIGIIQLPWPGYLIHVEW
jgi:hypothetical protein